MGVHQAGICIFIIGIVMFVAGFAVRDLDNKRKSKYTKSTYGKVVAHKWRRGNSVSYPCAVVEYSVAGKTYHCTQNYASVYFNSLKHNEYDWEIDDNYCLHIYVTSRCRIHVNPIEDWFPVNSELKVMYSEKNPKKSYCGSLVSMKLVWIVCSLTGLATAVFGAFLAVFL